MTTASGKPEGVRKVDRDSGAVYLRDAVTAAFFFHTPVHEAAQALTKAFEIFLDMIPPGCLRWASIGATSEEWKPFTKSTIEKCKSQLTLPAVRARKLTSFELSDGQNAEDAPGYGFILVANPDFAGKPDKRNLIQMYFAPETIAGPALEPFLEKLRTIAAAVPYVSGYCSPGLHWSELFAGEAFTAARGLAMRHPGYDVQYNELGRSQIDDKVRGARWITFLGPAVVEKLGGAKQLRNALPETVSIEGAGQGTMVRAGERPEIGDVNRKIGTPLLSRLARVLEPVTLFGEPILLKMEFADGDPDVLSRWERRFLK